MKLLREEIYRSRWLLLILPLTFLVLRWWYLRGRPQRLAEFTGGYGRIVHAGTVYWLDSRAPGSLVVRALPLSGGKPYEVGRDEAKDAIFRPVAVTSNGVYYLVDRLEPLPPATLSLMKFVTGPWLTFLNPDLFTRFPTPQHWAGKLRRISLRGGKALEFPWPIDRLSVRQPESVRRAAVQDGHIYWICDRPTGTTSIFDGPAGRRLWIDARAELMSSSETELSPTLLARDLPPRGVVSAFGPGVIVEAPHRWPDVRRDFYYFARGSASPVALRDRMGAFPVALEDRLYWIRQFQGADGQELVTTMPDGSDERVVLRAGPGEGENLGFGQLAAVGRHLYIVRISLLRNRTIRRTLCRIDPSEPERLESLTWLPNNHSPLIFTDDTAYFVQLVEREVSPEMLQQGQQFDFTFVLYGVTL